MEKMPLNERVVLVLLKGRQVLTSLFGHLLPRHRPFFARHRATSRFATKLYSTERR
jgi:hypothetical protein